MVTDRVKLIAVLTDNGKVKRALLYIKIQVVSFKK